MGIYSLVFTNVFLSIQVYMIGRYLFLQFINEEKKDEIQVETQREFLSYFGDHFQKEGIQKLYNLV